VELDCAGGREDGAADLGVGLAFGDEQGDLQFLRDELLGVAAGGGDGLAAGAEPSAGSVGPGAGVRRSKLWLKPTPFGHLPPARHQIGANVMEFAATNENNVLVPGTDSRLWWEQAPWNAVLPKRQLIDGTVA